MIKRFQNNVISKEVSAAITEAEALLDPRSLLMAAIRESNHFKYYSGTGEEIYSRLTQERDLILIFTYRPRWPWSKVLGYFDGKSIHINVKKLDQLDHAELVGLLVHEYAHYCGFTHGNNYPSQHKNDYSVPYWISSNIKKWI